MRQEGKYCITAINLYTERNVQIIKDYISSLQLLSFVGSDLHFSRRNAFACKEDVNDNILYLISSSAYQL